MSTEKCNENNKFEKKNIIKKYYSQTLVDLSYNRILLHRVYHEVYLVRDRFSRPTFRYHIVIISPVV